MLLGWTLVVTCRNLKQVAVVPIAKKKRKSNAYANIRLVPLYGEH